MSRLRRRTRKRKSIATGYSYSGRNLVSKEKGEVVGKYQRKDEDQLLSKGDGGKEKKRGERNASAFQRGVGWGPFEKGRKEGREKERKRRTEKKLKKGKGEEFGELSDPGKRQTGEARPDRIRCKGKKSKAVQRRKRKKIRCRKKDLERKDERGKRAETFQMLHREEQWKKVEPGTTSEMEHSTAGGGQSSTSSVRGGKLGSGQLPSNERRGKEQKEIRQNPLLKTRRFQEDTYF